MLLEEFSTIFDRPEKVKKLREYILSLAVRGKLVEQDENDEPASVLIERIREEKERLVKEKKIKKENPLPEISEDEIPYELPKGWEWVRLGELCKSVGGNGFPVKYQGLDTGKIPFFKVSDLSNESNSDYVINSKNWIEDDEVIKKFTLIDKYSVVFPKIGGALLTNNRKILGLPGFIDNNCMALTCWNKSMYKYIFLFMKTIDLGEFCKGTSVPSVSQSVINNLLIPVPPIIEQNLIIEKVDYFMEFCDKLEEQLEKQVKYASLSAKSVLNGVSNCSSYEELEEALRFILENFKDLTLADGAVGELKNAILSLAVKGKLVPQDESDEPASVLLERIREDKDRLVKEKKIKKEKPLPEISEDEILYEIPKGWEWIRLGDIISILTDYHANGGYKILKENVTLLDNEDYAIMVRITNLGENAKKEYKYITKESYEFLSKSKLYENDIVMSKITDPGTVYYVPNLYKPMSLAMNLFLIRINENLESMYIYYYLKIMKEYIKQFEGGTATKTITKDAVKNLLIAIPPKNEQILILEKIDKLMNVCDELELRIEESKKYNEKLMESILKESFKA